MAPRSTEGAQSPSRGHAATSVLLLDIFRTLQRIESRIEDQDGRLSMMERSICSVPPSPIEAGSLPDMASLEGASRSASSMGREPQLVPSRAFLNSFRSSPHGHEAARKSNTKFEFHDSKSDLFLPGEKVRSVDVDRLANRNTLQAGYLSTTLGEPPHPYDDQGEERYSVSVYSVHVADSVQLERLDMGNTGGRFTAPETQGERSGSTPISVAYSDVESRGWSNTDPLDVTRATTDGSPANKPAPHERVAMAFYAYENWKEGLKAKYGLHQSLEQKLKWVGLGQVHALEMREKRQSGLVGIWKSVLAYVRKQTGTMTTGWVVC
ncbi:hypothetical protein MFIFM68171_06619 [Madurella fahalii]|uniref:Uncharacterized protein n=1 Tax=Madurella fahalii TaxID=1157608 RepID=A0ABQ0GFG7_9PEZI